MKATFSGSTGATSDEPISGALRGHLIEIAALMQTLPQESFEMARVAFKGAMAELERVEELENKFTETQVYERNC